MLTLLVTIVLTLISLSPLIYLFYNIKKDIKNADVKVEFVEEKKIVDKYEVGERISCDKFNEEGCLFCHSKDFIDDPNGVLCGFFICDRCGARFNYAPFNMYLLSKPTKEIK